MFRTGEKWLGRFTLEKITPISQLRKKIEEKIVKAQARRGHLCLCKEKLMCCKKE